MWAENPNSPACETFRTGRRWIVLRLGIRRNTFRRKGYGKLEN